MDKNESAFPGMEYDETAGQRYHYGMTLRDYFAAAALNECLAATDTMRIAAERAYQMADAMLEAREKDDE